MTCIVGIEAPDGALLAADSISSNGADMCVRADRKLIRLGPYALGFTSSWRFGDILRYQLVLPPPPRRGNVHRHLVREVVPALRKALTENGFATKDPENPGGAFLMAVQGRVFTIHADLQVGRSAHGYDALGSGSAVAMGALAALPDAEPRARARASLVAAERHTPFVRRPWRFLWTPRAT